MLMTAPSCGMARGRRYGHPSAPVGSALRPSVLKGRNRPAKQLTRSGGDEGPGLREQVAVLRPDGRMLAVGCNGEIDQALRPGSICGSVQALSKVQACLCQPQAFGGVQPLAHSD